MVCKGSLAKWGIWETPEQSVGFPGGSNGKESACNREIWVQSLGWEDPTPIFWPGAVHGQRNLVGYSSWGRRVGHDWMTFTFTEQSIHSEEMVLACQGHLWRCRGHGTSCMVIPRTDDRMLVWHHGLDSEAASRCSRKSSFLCPSAGQWRGAESTLPLELLDGLNWSMIAESWPGMAECPQMVVATEYPLIVWQLVCGLESREQRCGCWIKCFLSTEQSLCTL